MSQQDIFKKAIAAKLAGDDEGFKAAISEAIKAKTKALLSEAQNKGNGVELVGDDWFLVTTKFAVPEANEAGLPAGYYTASFKARADGLDDHATVEAIDFHPDDDDSIAASFTGEQANKIAAQYLPHSALMFADSYVEQAYNSPEHSQQRQNDSLEDRAESDMISQHAQ